MRVVRTLLPMLLLALVLAELLPVDVPAVLEGVLTFLGSVDAAGAAGAFAGVPASSAAAHTSLTSAATRFPRQAVVPVLPTRGKLVEYVVIGVVILAQLLGAPFGFPTGNVQRAVPPT